jgi:hypothetical protein
MKKKKKTQLKKAQPDFYGTSESVVSDRWRSEDWGFWASGRRAEPDESKKYK